MVEKYLTFGIAADRWATRGPWMGHGKMEPAPMTIGLFVQAAQEQAQELTWLPDFWDTWAMRTASEGVQIIMSPPFK